MMGFWLGMGVRQVGDMRIATCSVSYTGHAARARARTAPAVASSPAVGRAIATLSALWALAAALTAAPRPYAPEQQAGLPQSPHGQLRHDVHGVVVPLAIAQCACWALACAAMTAGW